MERFKEKVVIVTGAARGIGRACALAFAREGADLLILDVAKQLGSVNYPLATLYDLAETHRMIKALGRRSIAVQADVRDMKAMREAAERAILELGCVDIMILNVGIHPFTNSLVEGEQAWRDTIDVNLIGTANSMRAVIPHMMKRQSGRIVVVGSSSGRHGGPKTSHYYASKWAVIGLVKSMALELAPHNILVNAVAPMSVRTSMALNDTAYQWANPDNPTQEGMEQAMRNYNALSVAFIEPEEVAQGVLFLASEDARNITGTTLDIAAGANARYTA